MIRKLVEIQYERNDINFVRNKFRVRGDVVEIFPAYSGDNAIRVEFFGDEVDRISEINTLTGEVKAVVSHVPSIRPPTISCRRKSCAEDCRTLKTRCWSV